MAKRKAMSRKKSKRNFSKGTHVNARNHRTSPMRGGIRL